MQRALLVFAIGLYSVSLAGQTPAPPRRPVMELGLALSRFNNGTGGFSKTELSGRMIGFAQATAKGEFAIAYFEDKGDNQIHPPLRLAFSTPGQPWKRAAITTPAAIVDAVGTLYVGRDYLLANTGGASATRQLVVFDKALTYLRSTGGSLAVGPLSNDTVVFSENRSPSAPALRTTFAVFDVHSGAVSALYPGVTPVEPSPAYQKLLKLLVRDLNREVPRGNGGRGYREEWYAALTIARPQYDPVQDVVTFTETIAPTWPMPASPKLSSQVETFEVTCGPMLKSSRRCVEGARKITVLKTGR